MAELPDPLAPPEGYGKRLDGGAGAGAGSAAEGDFSTCCQAGCGAAAAVVWTLGCTRAEHVGRFPYCQRHAEETRRVLPRCGRCDRGGVVSAMRILDGPGAGGVRDPALDALMGRIFDGKPW